MIKQMKYFQAVVKFQSFTKAADECYISQSAISQQIQALEKDLSVQLLKREGRKFSLTKAGEFFYRKIFYTFFIDLKAHSSKIVCILNLPARFL